MKTFAGNDPRNLILYDASCGQCASFARRFARIFGRRGFAFAPLQAPSLQARLRSRATDPLAEMRVLTAAGEDFGGADAFIFLARRVWWMWPCYAAAQFPGMRPRLRRIYRWIAARRNCAGRGCAISGLEDSPG